jgi:hypothetical protein
MPPLSGASGKRGLSNGVNKKHSGTHRDDDGYRLTRRSCAASDHGRQRSRRCTSGGRGMKGNNAEVEAALWLLAQLPTHEQNKVRRRLSLRLNPPTGLHEDYRRDLCFVAEQLQGLPLRAGWSFPYLPRKEYDRTRSVGSASSAALVARYGSWVAVCRSAYRFCDASDTQRRVVTPRRRGGERRPPYTNEDAVAALRECAMLLNRVPSRRAYNYWRTAAERRRPQMRYPCASSITDLYKQAGGWIAALEDAQLVTRPRRTVRVIVPNHDEALKLFKRVCESGLTAARTHTNYWFEVRGTTSEVKPVIIQCARDANLKNLTFWEPARFRMHQIQLQPFVSHAVDSSRLNASAAPASRLYRSPPSRS